LPGRLLPAVLLLRDSPSLWRSVTSGVMMGAATIVRPTVMPLVILIPIYLLIRRVGGAGRAPPWWPACCPFSAI